MLKESRAPQRETSLLERGVWCHVSLSNKDVFKKMIRMILISFVALAAYGCFLAWKPTVFKARREEDVEFLRTQEGRYSSVGSNYRFTRPGEGLPLEMGYLDWVLVVEELLLKCIGVYLIWLVGGMVEMDVLRESAQFAMVL